MPVLTQCPSPARARSRPADALRDIAVGLGTVQLLLDVGQAEGARKTLRAVRGRLQALRRSSPR